MYINFKIFELDRRNISEIYSKMFIYFNMLSLGMFI